MKFYLSIALFFITLSSFSQKTGSIQGRVLDIEENNSPLHYAKILIKETGAKILSNEKGFFKFDNLQNGDYTLVCSFIGYQTKELNLKVIANNITPIKISLRARSVSVEELMLTLASAAKE